MPTPIRTFTKELQTKVDQEATKLIAFSVTITTPNRDYAGTDADVFIEIAGHSNLMDKPKYNDFERGDTDTYYFPIAMTLGDLRTMRIRVHHNNKGRNSGWYCGRVTMQVQYSGSSYMRLYKAWPDVGWLAKDEGPYHTTEAILQEGKEV